MTSINTNNNDFNKVLKIEYDLDMDSLKCCVCLNYIVGEIYRCTNALHMCCKECTIQLKSCPTCRHQSAPIRDTLLEKSLEKYMITCPNDGCNVKMLQCDTDHPEQCLYAKIKCTVCKRMISSTLLNIHSALRRIL